MTEKDFVALNGFQKKRLIYKGEIVALNGINNIEKLLRINHPQTPNRKIWVRHENVEVVTNQ